MKCIFCGYDTDNYKICPGCGRDLTVFNRIQIASALCYNEGLRKARVRDLSGAIDELTKSLKYNKYNTDARNLLGLVYFEIGEPVNAMGEWVISKNLSPEDNLADKYLSELQRDSGMLNRMDSATKKYNQAITYIQHGDYDLAKIQLKRLVSKNPGMIRARSLLALLYLKNGEPRAARKELAAAGKIDVGNPTINTYFQEVKEGLRQEGDRARGRRRADREFTEETVVTENVSRFTYIMDYSKVSVVNIIIGAVLGLLVSMFLIFPAIRQSANSDALSALITAKEDARSTENDISAMQQTIDGLNARLETYEGKSDVKGSYEALVAAVNAVNSADMETAAREYASINRDLLDIKGKETFDSLSGTVGAYTLHKTYESAKALLEEEHFREAAGVFSQVVSENEAYENGDALEGLAICYENLGETNQAVSSYNRLAELYPGLRIGRNARAKAQELAKSLPEEVPDDDTPQVQQEAGTEE